MHLCEGAFPLGQVSPSQGVCRVKLFISIRDPCPKPHKTIR